MTQPNITLLTSTPTWYGNKSGYYEQLAKSLAEIAHIKTLRPPNSILSRIVGKAISLSRNGPQRNQSLTYIETIAELKLKRHPRHLLHITNLEAHLPMFRTWKKAPNNLVATIHFPPSCWSPSDLKLLARLSSAIVLYKSDIAFFEQYVGKGRVKFVPHGVDTDFFTPTNNLKLGDPHVVFCGQFLRDLGVLVKVIERLNLTNPSLKFDLVLPPHAVNQSELASLQNNASVQLHSGLSDTQFRDTFCNARVAVMPMIDCAASNSIVEFLSCGVPLVGTDVGGMKDYGGGKVFPMVPVGDAEAMAREVLKIVSDSVLEKQIAKAQREFAVGYLSWKTSADLHIQAYSELFPELVQGPRL